MAGPVGGAASGADTEAAAGGEVRSRSSPVGTARIGDSEPRFRPCPATGAPVPVRADPAKPVGATGFAGVPRRGPVLGDIDGRVVFGESAAEDAVPTAPPEPVESA